MGNNSKLVVREKERKIFSTALTQVEKKTSESKLSLAVYFPYHSHLFIIWKKGKNII